MELKSIPEIKETPNVGYKEYLIDTYQWNSVDIDNVIDTIVNSNNTEVPLSAFSVKYLLAFYREHLEEFRLEICEKAFCEEGLLTLKWEYNNIPHIVFISKTQSEEIKSTVRVFKSNTIVDYTTIAELEADPDFTTHQPYLSILGLTFGHSFLAPNSPSIVNIDNTARFSSAIWYENIKQKEVILAGLGGIGSYVAFLLSRVQPKKITLYDDDIIESVNLSGQLYTDSDIDKYKVDAMALHMINFSRYNNVFSFRERFVETTSGDDIMICGFDNMEARKIFFQVWKNHVLSLAEEKRSSCLYIDGRLNAEELQVFCIRGDDSYNINQYEETYLFSDEDADETICSYKQTSYMANMIGSIIVNLFINFTANQVVDGLRDLPFYTNYVGDSMTFKTCN